MGKRKSSSEVANVETSDLGVDKKEAWRKGSKENKKKWKEMKLLKQLEKRRLLKENTIERPAGAAALLPFPAQPVSRPAGTIALAVPGSILDNAQSRELRAYLAGQVSRAAAIYRVSEVVVFNDQGAAALRPGPAGTSAALQLPDCCQQLARILQYMECPQYLRKHLFPMHEDLRFAGLLNPLDCPHHLRRDEHCAFREGVVAALPPAKTGSYVNIGLQKEVPVDRQLTPGLRVTVRLSEDGRSGQVVPPHTPFTEAGLYWGYSVRLARDLSHVFTDSPHPAGYDLLIGTSDKGDPISEATVHRFQHALVVFGGVQGLEAALENDDQLTLDDPADLFDVYLNTCPGQGSRTIRTEEAILITLAALQPKLTTAETRNSNTGESGD